MNEEETTEGEIRLIKEGDHPDYGPWRLYAAGHEGQAFFAYPGPGYNQLEALTNKHAKVNIQYNKGAWKYKEGSARETPAPTQQELDALRGAKRQLEIEATLECVEDAWKVAQASKQRYNVTFKPAEIQDLATGFYIHRHRNQKRR